VDGERSVKQNPLDSRVLASHLGTRVFLEGKDENQRP